jgi:hypothetical protein
MLLHSVVLLGLLILMGFQEVLALTPLVALIHLVVQEVLALIHLVVQEVLAQIRLVGLLIQLWEEVITWDLQIH